MDLRKIKKLIELLNESGVGEIEITEGEDSVRISRESSAKKMVTKNGDVSIVSGLLRLRSMIRNV